MTADPGLKVEGLRVTFGGLVAVDDVDLTAPIGRLTGLIGPNGAGKTTLFNACSGLLRPDAGRVSIHGEDVSRLGPAARAQRGLGRTFQRMELFDSLTVAENVALGREAALAGRRFVGQLWSGRGEDAEVEQHTEAALALCGLEADATRPVSLLPTGARRLVELARALAGPFSVLLLDEPSSGLDEAETERFGSVLGEVRSSRDVAILLVEHDMSLVMGVCEHVYVLDSGRLIFDGTPDDASRSSAVQEAYLGSAA